MNLLREEGDAIEGERIVCTFRKKNKEIVVPLTGGHRGMRMVVMGLPAKAIIDRAYGIRRDR